MYYDPWHPPCSYFTCLKVFFDNLSPSFLWSTSWPGALNFILHTFLHQSLSSFRNTCQYHCNLFCCSTEIMLSNPSLSFNPLLGCLSCTLTTHIYLTILISEVRRHDMALCRNCRKTPTNLISEEQPHFLFLWTRSHFHATYYVYAGAVFKVSKI